MGTMFLIAAVFLSQVADPATLPDQCRWHYTTKEDELGRGTSSIALVESVNEIELDIPYQGKQRGTIMLIDVYGKQKTAGFYLKKGIIPSSTKSISAVGDDGVVVRFACKKVDNTSESITFTDYDKFYSAITNTKNIRLEIPVLDEPSKYFDFYVAE